MATLVSGTSHRRTFNSDLPLVPFIDFLLCLIMFLLVTAVWSEWGRLGAQGSGAQGGAPVTPTPRTTVHIDARDPRSFRLSLRSGDTVLDSLQVHRNPAPQNSDSQGGYRDLTRAYLEFLRTHLGAPYEPASAAVLHVGNDAPFSEVAGALDAVSVHGSGVPRLAVEFASD